MQNITTVAELRKVIKELEDKLANEKPLMKKEFLATCKSLTLKNIIKSTFKKAITAPDLKANMADTAIGLTTGFIAKKAMIGKTKNPFKKLLGLILEITVANKIANNADSIRTVGGILLNQLIPSKKECNNK
jgi:hypothetical protein